MATTEKCRTADNDGLELVEMLTACNGQEFHAWKPLAQKLLSAFGT